MKDMNIGYKAIAELAFRPHRVEAPIRVLIANLDYSGSMSGKEWANVAAVKEALATDNFDIVVIHEFEHWSAHHVFYCGSKVNPSTEGYRHRVSWKSTDNPNTSAEKTVALLRAGGSTDPREHAEFLSGFTDTLAKLKRPVKLTVVSSSDGGFDGGAKGVTATAIHKAMQRLCSLCECHLLYSVLVGSYGSPEALFFFAGDPEKYTNRVLATDDKVDEAKGVIRFGEGNLSKIQVGTGVVVTLETPLTVWRQSEGKLYAYEPPGPPWGPDEAQTVGVIRSTTRPDGIVVTERAEAKLDFKPVTLEREGQEVFTLIAESFSDNAYLRETSRGALNRLIAPLERLLSTREAVVAMLTAAPELKAEYEAKLALGTQLSNQLNATQSVAMTRKERASRSEAINVLLRQVKKAAREIQEKMAQEALERELGWMESHPNHWLVWLEPALEELKGQLTKTQAEVGDVMSHLSTRIQSAKAKEDGNARAVDRYRDKLLQESRERRDRKERAADPQDAVPWESNSVGWAQGQTCPISGSAITNGIAVLPFVADRRDLTSGNIMSGGQNVDRMPVTRGFMSLEAATDLMWGELGQMASPYVYKGEPYNAGIPVLLGPASCKGMRELEKAIGWLSTGTTAFAPQMAEAVPGALVSLLGDVEDQTAQGDVESSALLATTALFSYYKSYPYINGTATFNEGVAKQSLPVVWHESVSASLGNSCLAQFGCITSFFARAVASGPWGVQEQTQIAKDLFSWGVRNAARSILNAKTGVNGVEGVRLFAQLWESQIDLRGFEELTLRKSDWAEAETEEIQAEREEGGLTIDKVLGTEGVRLFGDKIDNLDNFFDKLNAAMLELGAEKGEEIANALPGILDRFTESERSKAPPMRASSDEEWDSGGESESESESKSESESEVQVKPTRFHLDGSQVHKGFGVLNLDALSPVRFSTPTFEIASRAASIRWRLFAGEKTWIAPSDSLSRDTNPSLVAWLDQHSAFMPLLAWLRLCDARFDLKNTKQGFFGRSLSEFRQSGSLICAPRIDSVLTELVSKLPGGWGELYQLFLEALDFVVLNAYGYADSAWADRKKRKPEQIRENLKLAPLPPKGIVRRYTSGMYPNIEVDDTWPPLTRKGYISKAVRMDRRGNWLQAPKVKIPPELNDKETCSLAVAAIIEELKKEFFIVEGLHRQAREVLGAYPEDLSNDPNHTVIIEKELVPIVAGKVKGDIYHPDYFDQITNVLHQLCALGTDTTSLRGQEDDQFLSEQAAIIRKNQVK